MFWISFLVPDLPAHAVMAPERLWMTATFRAGYILVQLPEPLDPKNKDQKICRRLLRQSQQYPTTSPNSLRSVSVALERKSKRRELPILRATSASASSNWTRPTFVPGSRTRMTWKRRCSRASTTSNRIEVKKTFSMNYY